MKVRRFFLITLLATLAGCVGVDSLTSYPSGWPALGTRTLGDCPWIAGTYRAGGVQEGTCKPDLAFDHSWSCAGNLGTLLLNVEADQVTLSQPDMDRLVVIARVGGTETRKEFDRRRNEFSCRRESLDFFENASLFGDNTLGFLMLLRGGVVDFRRSFSKLANGDLVMRRSEHAYGLIAPIPLSRTIEDWTRWFSADE